MVFVFLLAAPSAVWAQPVLVVRGHSGPIRSVGFSEDNARLYSLGGKNYEDTFRVTDVKDGKTLANGICGERVLVAASALAPNRKVVVLVEEQLNAANPKSTVWYRPLEKDKEFGYGHDIHVFPGRVLMAAFAPDGQTFAVVSQDNVCIFDGQTRQLLNTTAAKVTCLAYAGDNKILATGNGAGEVTFWKVETMKPSGTFAAHFEERVVNDKDKDKKGNGYAVERVPHIVTALAFDPKSEVLATAGRDNLVKLWGRADKKLKATLKGHENPVRSIAFSPDGKLLATGSEDHTIKLWDAADGKELATIDAHLGPVTCLAFSGDGKLLASGAEDRLVKVWDVGKAVAK
jgi:WD40 repeat protein